jgi:hypothetical protein
MNQAIDSEPTWETEVEARVVIWRKQLGCLMKPDGEALPALQTLKAAVDVQLALADLKIRSRTADWAKIMVWTPLVLPFICAILGAILGALLRTPTH